MEVVWANGLEVAYERVGEGPPLVFVHGAAEDGRVWQPQVAALADEFTVVAWDEPGAGRSSDVPAGFGLADYADCLAALVETLGLGRAHVAGLSWGGTVVLELYRRYPRLVAMIAFSPYAAGLAPLPVLVALLLRRWLVAAVAGVTAVALLAAVLPRTLAGPQMAQPDASGRTLVVMTANMRFGRADAAAVVRLVREHDVDVLSLQELTPDALMRLDAAGASKLLPARSVRPDMRWSGLGLLARVPLRAVPPPVSKS